MFTTSKNIFYAQIYICLLIVHKIHGGSSQLPHRVGCVIPYWLKIYNLLHVTDE